MKIINLTPHSIHIVVDGRTVTLPPEGTPPRVSTTETSAGTVVLDGAEVPVTTVATGELTGLPQPQEGVGYLVSRMVAEAAPQRRDLFIPHGLVRDEQGRVTGCSGLGQVPPPPSASADDGQHRIVFRVSPQDAAKVRRNMTGPLVVGYQLGDPDVPIASAELEAVTGPGPSGEG